MDWTVCFAGKMLCKRVMLGYCNVTMMKSFLLCDEDVKKRYRDYVMPVCMKPFMRITGYLINKVNDSSLMSHQVWIELDLVIPLWYSNDQHQLKGDRSF